MGGCDSHTCVPYSGFTSRQKIIANFVDLLLCVKIIFANTSCIAYKVWLKIQSTKFIFTKINMLMHAQVCVCVSVWVVVVGGPLGFGGVGRGSFFRFLVVCCGVPWGGGDDYHR